mgnify:CR=1 FL=1
MHRYLKAPQRSMLWRLSLLQLSFTALFILGVSLMNWDEHRALNNFQNRADELAFKERVVIQITQHINDIFASSRDYIENSKPDDFKYDRIFDEQTKYEEAVDQYRKLELGSEEKEWLNSLDAFFHTFFEEQLPEAREQAQKNDEAPPALNGRLNVLSDEVLDKSYKVMESNQSELEKAQERLNKRLSSQATRFMLYGLAALPLAVFLYYRMIRDLSIPIRRLSQNAKAFAAGRIDPPRYSWREDEIGELARSLDSMMHQIQSKEEELLAQNEELIAQQDELQMQQEELTTALARMEANERILQRRNSLVEALSTTLERQELLDSIVYNLVMLTETDKGLVIMLDGSRDYSSFGLSGAAISQLIESRDNGVLARILAGRKPYTIKRQAYGSEKGYVTEELSASDLYVPVLGADGKPMALIGLTSVGRCFTPGDEEEMVSFALQVSLSLEKLKMYENAESQRRLTQDMLDTIQEGIQLLDSSGTTIQVNRKWCEMMGLPEKEELDLDLKAFGHLVMPLVDEPEKLLGFISAIVEGEREMGAELVYRMTGPEPKFIRMYYEPLMENKVQLGYLLVHRDITKEHEADQLKSEFVSTVSHELRTPLASILGFAELLLYKQLTEERQRKYVSTIHQEANRLTSLINDFLDLQRMESGRTTLHPKELEIAKLVRNAMEIHAVQAKGHRFYFTDESEGAIAKVDEDKINQALTNVLGNAVKYSPGGGDISIVCSLRENRIQVSVEDRGLGIPKESLPKLFEKFYRVDNGDRRKIGGTGLGLSIVKEIMTLHEGEIEVSSEYGQGTTVTLSFPRMVERTEADRGTLDSGESAYSEGHATILLVEDDASMAELLSGELRENGYRVIACDSGEAALARMNERLPDAVVLDLLLSKGMSGLDFLERIKANERLSGALVLVSSAFEEEERARQLGAKGYLVKPYYPSQLVEALGRLLSDRD